MDDGGVKDSRVICANSQGLQITGSIIQLGRHQVVFEIYSPAAVIQSSESLREFRIELRNRRAYGGRAVVKDVVHTELKVVCAAALDEDGWELEADQLRPGQIQTLLREHMREWQKLYLVRPEYKIQVADMESFFAELRVWLNQVEFAIRSGAHGGDKAENEIARELGASVLPTFDAFFEKFEHLAEALEPGVRAFHRAYLQRRLHPLILCSPFVHRTYTKPLGYAGDYEMVNMIARNAPEGPSLYAKVVNFCFVRQPPATAHRNRLKYLTQRLMEESARAASGGENARILSLACGPAVEIQDFLRTQEISNRADFTLLDFNDETLEYAAATFAELKSRHGRRTPIQFVKRSVHHLLKESVRAGTRPVTSQYDFVYCAGLFDYLTDAVCQRLIGLLYEWVAPGGLLLLTNVDATLNDLRSFRHSLDFVLDWNLIYRRSSQFNALIPEPMKRDACIRSDDTGVNLFLEVRKPNHG
jgi:extracellular factor (EF) 3-hydroxypalmitic acid methyl ester biosynthesis protein